jgi:hypothetical protein
MADAVIDCLRACLHPLPRLSPLLGAGGGANLNVAGGVKLSFPSFGGGWGCKPECGRGCEIGRLTKHKVSYTCM